MPVMAHPSALHRTRGFTLVEVMVALTVLSIGLLGIGKLMLFSSHGNNSAYMRTQATELAYTIIDRLRANVNGAVAGNYNVALGSYANPGVNCATSVCNNSSLLAQSDLYQWKQAMLQGLPAGDGTVSVTTEVDPVTGNSVATATVTVQWNDVVAQQSLGGTSATAVITLQTFVQ